MSPRLAALARETLLLVLGALAVYLLLCLASYARQDPGWSHSGSPDQIVNLGGRVGAWIADILLHGFGYVAYLFPVLIALSALRIYRQRLLEGVSLYQQLRTGAGFVVSVLSACGLERLHLGGLSDGQSFIAGGVVGDLVAGALTENFGIAGATMFLLVLFAAGVSWFTEVSSFAVIDAIGKFACDAWDRLRGMVSALAEKWAKRAATPAEPKIATSRAAGPAAAIREEISRRKPPRLEPQIDKPMPPPQVVARKPAAPRVKKTRESGEIPPLSLLDEPDGTQVTYSQEALESMSRLIEKKLMDFNVAVQVLVAHPGPVITRFEIEPAPGIKASQITGLSRDLARALGVFSVRVVENIPGKTVIGLEVPNEQREIVRLVEGLASREYQEAASPLTLVLGKDIGGLPVLSDLGRMPHVLIAGTTGSGKSVCINALILSMLYKATARDVRLIMVDPKMLELSVYDGIPHLLTPVVTDMKEATNALRWCIGEMDRRFHLMAALGVRNIAGYNRKVQAAIEAGKPIADPLVTDPEVEALPLDTIPYVVVIIDELADLLMVVGKKVEELITRIAQRARAAGIHLVLATQRPSVDVITGLIKANVPTRIAFQVSSRADSRTVLDQMGAEQLLGHGDMLFLPPGTGAPLRVHGSFVSDQEVHQVVSALKGHGAPDYNPDVIAGDLHAGDPVFGGGDNGGGGGEEDALYDQALKFVTETRRASISAVQRHLRVGYNRAARMIEAMEQAGVVGPLETNGKRDVLAPPPPDA